MAKKNTTPSKTLSQMEEEDFNNFFQQYKIPLLGLVGVILIAVVGAGFYQKSQEKKQNLVAEEVFNFKSEMFTPWQEQFAKKDEKKDAKKDGDKKEEIKEPAKKVTWAEVKSSYNSLVAKTGHTESLTPLIIDMVTELIKQNKKQEAFDILKPHYENATGPSLFQYVIGSTYAGLGEDLGKTDLSIEANEKLLTLNPKFMEPMVYFNLGRLYKKSGNLEKAKQNFEYLVKNFSKDEIVPMAQVYLSEL